MTLMRDRRFQIRLVTSLALLLVTAGVAIHYATRVELPSEADGLSVARGFSFLELGADSVFTRKTRSHLKDRLGPDRIEAWTPIDLVAEDRAFFAAQLPEIIRLNEVMQYGGGTLAGKMTPKVNYRYARNKKLPFHMIRLVFLERSKSPLYFTATARGEGTAFPALLQEKYGAPALFRLGGAEYSHWRSENELLMVARKKDRYGKDLYTVTIYFLDNVRALAEEVAAAREAEERKRRGAESSAF